MWDITLKTWNKDRIEHEWKTRVDYLANQLNV